MNHLNIAKEDLQRLKSLSAQARGIQKMDYNVFNTICLDRIYSTIDSILLKYI